MNTFQYISTNHLRWWESFLVFFFILFYFSFIYLFFAAIDEHARAHARVSSAAMCTFFFSFGTLNLLCGSFRPCATSLYEGAD